MTAPSQERPCQESSSRWRGRRFRACRVRDLLILNSVICIAWGHPLIVYLWGGAALWWWSGARPGALAKTVRGITARLLIGLSLVCVALLALNVFLEVDTSAVHDVQLDLAHLRLAIADWTGLSLGRLVLLSTVLLAAVVLAARLKPVTRFEHVDNSIGSFQAVLFVVTSFAIYAQPALALQADQIHHRIRTEYRAGLQRQWSAEAAMIAAQSIQRTVQAMSAPDRDAIGTLFQRIDSASVNTVDSPGSVAGIENSVLAIPPGPPVTLPAGDGLQGTDTSLLTAMPASPLTQAPATPQRLPAAVADEAESNHQLTAQLDALDAERQAADHAQEFRQQAVSLARKTITRLISLAIPVDSEPLHMAIDDWIDNLTETLQVSLDSGESLDSVKSEAQTLADAQGRELVHANVAYSLNNLELAAQINGLGDPTAAKLANESADGGDHVGAGDISDSGDGVEALFDLFH